MPKTSLPALLALLLLPLASATPATEPYAWSASLEREPAVGETVTITVSVEARRPLDAPLRLETPAWVEVEGPREWRAQAEEGGRAEQAWRVTATRTGFWRASLAVDATRAAAYEDPVDPARAWQPVGGCCLFAWSFDQRGMSGAQPEAAVPGESTVGFHTSLRALDEARAELSVRVSPQDRRYVGQTLVLQVPMGSGEVRSAPADAPHVFTHAFPLRAGETAHLTPAAYVRISFEQGEHAGEPRDWWQHVACANLAVERAGDEVREVGRTGCSAAATRPRALPAVGAALVVMVALAAATGRRPRG